MINVDLSGDRSVEVMPFGMHKGKTFEQIPSEYLYWLIGETEIDKAIRKEAELEHTAREKNDQHWYSEGYDPLYDDFDPNWRD